MGMLRRATLWGAALTMSLACLAPANTALAASPQEIKLSRELGTQGIEDYQAGRHAEAHEKLERAYKLNPVPSLGLWSARAAAQVGKLVLASERYRAVTRTELGPKAPDAFKEAVRDAAQELPEVEARIPRLTVQVEGAEPNQVEVSIDGGKISSATLGMALPIDPGQHEIVGRRGEQEVKEIAVVPEKARQLVTLRFEGPPVAGTTPAALPVSPKEEKPEQVEPKPGADAGASSSGSPSPLTWVAFGVGAVGLGLGVVTGLMAQSKESDLKDECPNDQCPPELHSDVDSMNQLATLSTIGFIVGGVGLAAGGVLLFTSGGNDGGDTKAGVRGYVGFGSVSLAGRF